MLRPIIALSAASGIGLYRRNFSHCSADAQKWPFEAKGMPLNLNPNLGSKNRNPNLDLLLAGVGMRRKNLYVVEVDVYLIGISFTTPVVKSLKEWSNSKKDKISLTDFVFKECITQSPPTVGPCVCATLRFCRSVTRDQFLNAFDDAFKGLPASAVAEFKASVGKSIGDQGIKQGDEVSIMWQNNGSLLVAMHGGVSDVLDNQELNQRLLEVYIHPTRSVSKELYQCIENHIADIPI